ncbi:MAG: Phosphoribosylaminoimidazole-succinocarboxamide synthase [Phycisphaerae bacterium]|nr:Phosphoribosylaminoimidazole-succinocarboxamide synthase [Phycisphaerae bacterium]
MKALYRTDLRGFPRRQGKVRDIYDLGSELLLVACDRISAFDVVMATAIPEKGRVLTLLSEFWFHFLEGRVRHHLISLVRDQIPEGLEAHRTQLYERAMRCRKCQVIPIECVVRGYLAGSGWKDYQKTGAVCGIRLPAGLQLCSRLPEPIFTPATKEESGHDQNISYEQAAQIVSEDTMRYLRNRSIEIYLTAAEYARPRGIILADTKFEWGVADGEYLLIDEVLTPDSSRFWPADEYQIGRDQDSYDKQPVRNYLQGLCDAKLWDKEPPGPELPADVVQQTTARYIQAYEQLTGKKFVRDRQGDAAQRG